MSGHDGEDPNLRLLRLIAVGVVLGVITLYVSADIFATPFTRIDFHVDTGVFGTLCGALLVLLGLIAAPKWPPRDR